MKEITIILIVFAFIGILLYIIKVLVVSWGNFLTGNNETEFVSAAGAFGSISLFFFSLYVYLVHNISKKDNFELSSDLFGDIFMIVLTGTISAILIIVFLSIKYDFKIGEKYVQPQNDFTKYSSCPNCQVKSFQKIKEKYEVYKDIVDGNLIIYPKTEWEYKSWSPPKRYKKKSNFIAIISSLIIAIGVFVFTKNIIYGLISGVISYIFIYFILRNVLNEKHDTESDYRKAYFFWENAVRCSKCVKPDGQLSDFLLRDE